MKSTRTRLEILKHVKTDILNVAYHEDGPANGQPVILLHGYPYEINSFLDVSPILAAAGFRVIVPYLRGHGPTRFLSPMSSRSGQQAALAKDVIDLMDALQIPRAILAGFDWGARAACVAAALWPQRVTGIVSVNGYLIQDISAAAAPLRADLEAGFWYFFYFLTERGREGHTQHRRAIARVIWTHNPPKWKFDDATLNLASEAFMNPDYVDVVIHSYRHRLGYAPGAPEYQQLERILASAPVITVPAVTLNGTAHGNFPATDGTGYAAHFRGPHAHHQVPNAGHNLPQESPGEFARAVLEVSELASGGISFQGSRATVTDEVAVLS